MIELQHRTRVPPGAHTNDAPLHHPDHILISCLCRNIVGDIACEVWAPHNGNLTHGIAHALTHQDNNGITIAYCSRSNVKLSQNVVHRWYCGRLTHDRLEKTISRRPVIPLFAFPGCSCVDQGLIQMTVQDLCPDRKRNISVSCKLLLEPQKTILPGISAAQDNLLLPLSLAPKMDSVA